MDLELAGKVALVTGGSRGIGRQVAARLALEGCALGVCGRTGADIESAAGDFRRSGAKVFGVTTDVVAPGGVEDFVEQAALQLGGVDLLVANVGGAAGGGLLDSTPEEWTRTFDLNVGHAARAIRSCVPHMEARGGGAVVVVASISGWKPAPRAQYGAAKAAEIYLAGALARELAPQRIRVNAVSPGSILIPDGGWDQFRSREPERFREFEESALPAGRLGSADEVANVVTFLLSERASWVNGTNICIDGAQGRPSAGGW